ncbi:Rad4 beta-hairpin domain 1 family protein [Cryptosporidium hominis]|nr:DNA repair protein [Cryptosporidium hominis]PPA64817.1 Rad4 beta-hairpin domain 1 family protein [Cryptosporidium hominis]
MQKVKNEARQVYILGWLIHLRILNRIVDNIFIKSHILSLYLYYNQEYDTQKSIRGIYQWFRKYFKTYYLPNEYWIYKLHNFETKTNNAFSKSNWMGAYYSLFSNEDKNFAPCLNGVTYNATGRVENNFLEKFQEIYRQFAPLIDQRSFFLGKILGRMISSILSGKCSAEASNILFATLLRSLGHHCRLTLFIPPIINFKKSCELQCNDRRAELWVEVFEPKFNKWISVDIHRGGWNFTGCSTVPFVTYPEKNTPSIEHNSDKGLFSKLFLSEFNDYSDDSDKNLSLKKITPISVIPLKKTETRRRSVKYEMSNIVEQDEQRESLAFEFSNKKKTESLTLIQLQCKIDISRTNIKHKINESIGWWIISVNEYGYLRETTGRYVSDWSQVFQAQQKNSFKQKVESIISTINSTSNQCSSRLLKLELLDDFELEKIIHENDVIPISKTSFKNHPKYAIISCLNSLEIIHPKEPIVGYFQGEPIYLRENVQTLKTKTQWDQEQREIKIGQQPIKIIFKKKNDDADLKGKVKLEYYAEFQTQIKPLAELNHLDQIPKDHFKSINISIKGNIPNSCVHIKDSCEGLNNDKVMFTSRYYSTWKTENIIDIIKRSNIDYARAFIGYDFKNGSKPKYDGVIIKKKDVTPFQSLKKRFELMNINKMANFIWNDVLQSAKDFLNSLSRNNLSNNTLNKDYDPGSEPNCQKLINVNYKFCKIKNLSERLLEESYKAINKKKRKQIDT